MTPSERYEVDILKQGFQRDPAQQHAVQALTRLYDMLKNPTTPGFLAGLFRKQMPVPGIYLVGSVGRGKTYLMDLFHECLDEVPRQRVHYHRFMLDIHEQLKHLPRSPDPLAIVARQIAEHSRVLCLDEFHVTDVADAMLLSGLLQTLFSNGVTLVATSNTPINDLYLNGLQRERFMLAIDLLNDYTVEVSLDSDVDYRLLHLEKGDTFLVGDKGVTEGVLKKKFIELSPTGMAFNASIEVHGRPIHTLGMADDVIWFDFNELCDTPRAAMDYLELAREYSTVFLSDIPVLTAARDSAAKRFMHLIDALYDHRVKLVASAEAAAGMLYRGELLNGMFERTVSRLIEMSSRDYLAAAHRP